VAELYDEQLFKEPPPPEECPICMLPLPMDTNESTFKSCCGKLICNGCIYAIEMSEGKNLCAFCRTTPPTSEEEENNRIKKLMDKGNDMACNLLPAYYARGLFGLAQDYQKARELWLKAGEGGCAEAYCNLGFSYRNGMGVERDMKKARHYFELAVISGDIRARHNLGVMEGQAGNIQRAFKHLIIGARAGSTESLDSVKIGFKNEMITKDEYANTLRAYQKRQEEMKSDERDKAVLYYESG